MGLFNWNMLSKIIRQSEVFALNVDTGFLKDSETELIPDRLYISSGLIFFKKLIIFFLKN